MKTIIINSYYSEIDYSDVNNSGVDGIYLITYNEVNTSVAEVKKLIETTYERLNDDENGELVHNLGEVLEVLQKEEKIVSWEYVESIQFDCDYGIFKD